MGGESGDVHAAAAVLDHHEDVEAAQEDGVDMREVDRRDRLGLGGEELSPGRAGALRGLAEADQFAVFGQRIPANSRPCAARCAAGWLRSP